jgi:drug/metabolite transporter (DMT)-like permease
VWRRPATGRPGTDIFVKETNIVRAVLWMCGTLLSFSVMAISIRALARTLTPVEILCLRSALGVVIFLLLLLLRPQLRHELRLRELRLHLRELRLHLLRNVISFAAQVGWVYSLTVLPLATVTALEFTAPAWAAVLAVLMLGERVSLARVMTVVMGIIGVLIIVRPGAVPLHPGAVVMVAVAMGFAITYIFTKKLTATESTFAILFWMNVIQFPLAALGADPSVPTRIEASQIAAVIGIAIAGITAHLCMTNAFRVGDAQVVVPLDFLRLPLIALLGWMLYSEQIDGLLFVGAGFIIVGILLNLRAETRRAKADITLPSA